MRFMELVDILEEKYEINILLNSNSAKITDIKFIDQCVFKFNENTLYIGEFNILKEKPPCPIMLFCFDDCQDLPEGSCYANVHKEDLIDLFNISKEMIFEDLRIGDALFELAKLVLDKKSIVYIINSAAKILGNALVLVDSENKILAYSTIFEITDPLWAKNVERGYCSHEFMQKVRSNKDMREWNKHGCEAKIITLSNDLQPKLVARIIQNGHVVGALIMIEHHTLIERSHAKQLPLIGNILFDTFNYDSTKGIQKSFNSTILYNLLDERSIETFELLDMSKTDFPKKMYVVVTQFVNIVENKYLKNTISMDLEQIFPNGNSVRYKSYMAILVSTITEKQKEKLNILALNEDINVGISWPFNDILDFKRFFNQAVTCIKQAQCFGKSKQIFDYTDFSYYDMLYNYTGKIPLKTFCHPALQILRDYDNDSYITLQTYLESNKNLGATADKLFIHRNTLNYRIKRIIKMTGLDLDDFSVIYSLMNSFRIESFLNSISTIQ